VDAPPTSSSPNPKVWPVLLLTVLSAPLSAWVIAIFNATYAIGDTLYRILRREAGFSDFKVLATDALNRIFDHGILQIVIGVAGNATIFAFLALTAGFSRPKEPDAVFLGGWRRLRIRPVPMVDVLLAVIGLLAFTSALDAVVQVAGFGEYGKLAEYRAQIGSLDLLDRTLLAMLLGFGAGTGEELFFRGYMLTRLEIAYGRVVALLVSSAVFGVFHWDPIHSPLAALMGVYLGLSVLFSGSLVSSIAAHVVNNIVATILVDANFGEHTTGAFIAVGFPLSGLILLWMWRRGRRRETAMPVW
jgi:membrane protease YdiL (CAAX protease family)